MPPAMLPEMDLSEESPNLEVSISYVTSYDNLDKQFIMSEVTHVTIMQLDDKPT